MFRLTPLVLLAALVVASTGRADTFVTGTETVNQTVFGGTTNYPLVNRVGGTAKLGYDFGIVVNGANVPTGASPVAGNFVNVLAVDQITSYNQFGGSNPLAGFAAGTTVTMISAVKGTVVPVGGGVFNVTFNNVAEAFYPAIASGLAGGYNPSHPATWGATNAAGTTFNTPTALYMLHAPVDVVGGFMGQGDFFPAGTLNSQTINTGTVAQQQARVLLGEVNNGGFLVINPSPGASGVGQLALADENLVTSGFAGPGLTAADKAAMDLMFKQLLGDGIFNASSFNASADFSTGSGELKFGISLDPGSFVPLVAVPEPTTFSVWALLLGTGGIGGTLRYYRAKWSRKAA